MPGRTGCEHGFAFAAPKVGVMFAQIRPAREDDAEAIARTHVACWEESYRGHLPDSAIDARPLEVRREQWSRCVRDPAQIVFVAELDGAVVGFASGSANEHVNAPYDGFLDTLYIRQSAHRKGIARLLLAAVARELLARGFHSMALLTLRDRNPACAFYERMGAIAVRDQPAPPALAEGMMDRVYAFPDLHVLAL